VAEGAKRRGCYGVMFHVCSLWFHVCNFWLYVYTFYVYMHTYRTGNLSVYMHTYRRKAKKRIELVVTFYVYMRICPKKSHFTYFWVKRETHPKFMRTLTFAI
jgi:hypothetical protein